MRVRKKKITVQQILVYAALCIAVFLSIFPIYWMIVASLKPVSETMAGFESLRIHHLTLENYQKVNAVVPMLNPVINSMFTMTMGTITSLLFCSLAGFAFAKFRFPGRDQLFMIVLLTLFIPQEVCVVPLYSVMRKLKLVNSLWSLIIPRAASALGIFYMRQYCMAIPNELIEASRIDGCSSLKMYTRVVVPVIKPGDRLLGSADDDLPLERFLLPVDLPALPLEVYADGRHLAAAGWRRSGDAVAGHSGGHDDCGSADCYSLFCAAKIPNCRFDERCCEG